MRSRFRNRADAGKRLAKLLDAYAARHDVLVLGLPRGGIPVAFEIAQHLHLPLDVFVVRKLGLPGHEELAIGAIASGGVRVLNRDVIDGAGVSEAVVASVAEREARELVRREHLYRDHRSVAEICGRTIILVDDGIATGATVRVAIQALRKRGAREIVVATPTIAQSTAEEMRTQVDGLFAVITPDNFVGVGQWYEDFSQTSDAEVCQLLDHSRHLPVSSKRASAPSRLGP